MRAVTTSSAARSTVRTVRVSLWRVLATGICVMPVAAVALAGSKPIAVSPGTPTGALVGQTCPTFSWGTVDGAQSYELVVYRLEDGSEEATPVMRKRFSGSVNGWTPSLDECLESGGRYAWSVRPLGRKMVSEWSAPSLFQVARGPAAEELEAALAVVQRYLVSRDDFETVSVRPKDPVTGSDQQVAPEAAAPAAVGTTQLSVDGGIEAVSFTGDGSTLTALDPANLSAGTAGISVTGTAANVTGTVALGNGGTGATDAAGARTNLGVAEGPHTADTDTTCLDVGVTCSFAASASEGGPASSGDSATGFFSEGQIEEPRIADEIARDSEVFSAANLASTLCAAFVWRYIDRGDGTVLDCSTGLLWLKDASCGDLGPNLDGTATWDEAVAAAAALASGACGLTDGSTAGQWRLPTAAEVCSAWAGEINYQCPLAAASDSLIDGSVGPPQVVNARGDAVWSEGDIFVGLAANAPPCYDLGGSEVCGYWTSSLHDGVPANRMMFDVYYYYINGDSLTNDFIVWPVRTP